MCVCVYVCMCVVHISACVYICAYNIIATKSFSGKLSAMGVIVPQLNFILSMM